MSFQTKRYRRFFKYGDRLKRVKTERLIQERRKAALPTDTSIGFIRLITIRESHRIELLISVPLLMAFFKRPMLLGG